MSERIGLEVTDAERSGLLLASFESATVNFRITEKEMETLRWWFSGWLKQKIEEMPTSTMLDLSRDLSGVYPPKNEDDIASMRGALLRAFVPPEGK